MKLNSPTPILYTKDIRSTIDFYTIHFGFVCRNYDEGFGWASLSNNDVELMLSKPNAPIYRLINLFLPFYFRINAVDELWDCS